MWVYCSIIAGVSLVLKTIRLKPLYSFIFLLPSETVREVMRISPRGYSALEAFAQPSSAVAKAAVTIILDDCFMISVLRCVILSYDFQPKTATIYF